MNTPAGPAGPFAIITPSPAAPTPQAVPPPTDRRLNAAWRFGCPSNIGAKGGRP